MATITERVITGSTANTTSYASASFTPTAGEVLCVIVGATGTTATDTTLTASANGMTFTRVDTWLHSLAGAVSVVFISDQAVPSSPSAMTVTFGCASDAATGAFVEVLAVTGLTKVGTAAIKQYAMNANIGAGNPYTATFASATDTNNPLVGFVDSFVTQAITAPSGWTEVAQPTNLATPAHGYESAKVESGATSTSYTWTRTDGGSPTSNVRSNVGAIEFDASGSGSDTPVSATETITPVATDTSTLQVQSTSTDTLTAVVTDAVNIQVQVATTNTLTPVVTDSASVTVYLSSADTLTPVATDTSNASVQSSLGTSDTAKPVVTDTSSIAVSIGASDTLKPVVTESRTLAVSIVTSDSAVIGLVESTSLAVALSALDTLTIGLSEASTVDGGTPAPTTNVYVFDGKQWVTATVRVWNGTDWAPGTLHKFNGTEWL